jgi:hypothetical protein
MLLAMSRGVVPGGTSRMEPSGSWILIGLLINYKDSAWNQRNARFDTMTEVPGGNGGAGEVPGDDLV